MGVWLLFIPRPAGRDLIGPSGIPTTSTRTNGKRAGWQNPWLLWPAVHCRSLGCVARKAISGKRGFNQDLQSRSARDWHEEKLGGCTSQMPQQASVPSTKTLARRRKKTMDAHLLKTRSRTLCSCHRGLGPLSQQRGRLFGPVLPLCVLPCPGQQAPCRPSPLP